MNELRLAARRLTRRPGAAIVSIVTLACAIGAAALGATRRQLGTIVIAETGRLVGFGLVVGLGLAWLGASTVRAFLFQIAPLDPLTLVAVASLIFALALLVSVRVDLGSVLKEQ